MKYSAAIFFFLVMFIMASCGGFGHRKGESTLNDTIDLKHIIERDTLIALTAYSSTSYFIYRGQAMGFEYELLKQFSKHLGVELRMVVVREVDSILPLLNSYNGDLIASAMAVTQRRRESVDFTDPLT
jgi:membrane-bound lytic murein transglycosylase F